MRPKCGGKSGNGFIFKKINENEKKPAQFEWKWAGLAVLFSR